MLNRPTSKSRKALASERKSDIANTTKGSTLVYLEVIDEKHQRMGRIEAKVGMTLSTDTKIVKVNKASIGVEWSDSLNPAKTHKATIKMEDEQSIYLIEAKRWGF